MKNALIRGWLAAGLISLAAVGWAQTQELRTIKLNEPNKKRGLPVMEALSVRASVRDWSPKEVALQDLSDLLWAADGINRPDSKKRTASSAQNAQDVDIYVFLKDGVYVYDAAEHALVPVVAGDYRQEVVAMPPGGPPPAKLENAPRPKPEGPPGGKPGTPPTPAPVLLVLVSDVSRFRGGTPELKKEFAAIDTGIVSQNISIFCAATGMATRPRASMDRDKIRTLLILRDTQFPMLNHPVGYPK
ncbi:MAG TPA: SagB/ThcOx family dehydrogenase [Burkholderiales bacterium]|nr:SagB/ThcOx family dehydrogenase [Burkholderiales bacterium]